MHWVVSALRHLISGGQLTVVWQTVGVLGCYLAVSLLLTRVAVARKRTWTMGALHPSLTLWPRRWAAGGAADNGTVGATPAPTDLPTRRRPAPRSKECA